MTPDEIKLLCGEGTFERIPVEGELLETHISWIVLSKEYAFKIKKPVKFSFLDFSDKTQRKIYCEKEVLLNSRFSNIYLGTEPVFLKDGKWTIGGIGPEPIDFAVVMKKMDGHKRMDHLVESGEVSDFMVVELAKHIALFHRKAGRIARPFDLENAKMLFNDILNVGEQLDEKCTVDRLKRSLQNAVPISDVFLEKNQKYFQRRIELGFKRDLHGDLHCENVFLEIPPVIFDCIEFNDEYRQIDVLYDIAFMSMDLESWGRRDLSQLLDTAYKEHLHVNFSSDDDRIYLYFKCLRANIRAKTYALRIIHSGTETTKAQNFKAFKRYFSLFEHYVGLIEI